MADTTGFFTKCCIIPGRLDNKIAIVTGANTGIGLYTAGELARRGAIVIMACRNMERAQMGKEKLISLYSESNVDWMKTDVAHPSVVDSLRPIESEQLVLEQLDLASLDSVKNFAKRILQTYPKIHYLINNAGLLMEAYSVTPDGFETTIATNYLGAFLLTELLLPALKAAAPSRIINVTSMSNYYGQLYKPDLQMNEQNYACLSAYNSSKLANVMHAVELSKRLEGTGVIAVSLHPGLVVTEIGRNLGGFKMNMMKVVTKLLAINAWEGAQTTIYTVLMKNPTPGGYYSNCTLKQPNQLANNDEERKWLWEKSCELVGLAGT